MRGVALKQTTITAIGPGLDFAIRFLGLTRGNGLEPAGSSRLSTFQAPPNAARREPLGTVL
jgi:hypothetical protein